MLPLRPAQHREAWPHTRREAGAPGFPGSFHSRSRGLGRGPTEDRPAARRRGEPAAGAAALGTPVSRGREGAVPPRPRGPRLPRAASSRSPGGWPGAGLRPLPGAAPSRTLRFRVAATSLRVQDSPDAPRSSREVNRGPRGRDLPCPGPCAGRRLTHPPLHPTLPAPGPSPCPAHLPAEASSGRAPTQPARPGRASWPRSWALQPPGLCIWGFLLLFVPLRMACTPRLCRTQRVGLCSVLA